MDDFIEERHPDVVEALNDPTIENVVDALKAFVGRWDTDVVFQIDGKPVIMTDIAQTYVPGSGEHPPVVITLVHPS